MRSYDSATRDKEDGWLDMIGSGGIATYAFCGLTASAPFPLVGFVDEVATREQRLLQPYAWLEFYEIETTSSGTLRYVDFQDPDAGGTLVTQVAFDGDDYNSRKIKRDPIKTADGVPQFTVTFEDFDQELITAVDLDEGLNTEKLHIHRIPYDLIATKPQLAITDTFRIRSASASLGPDTVSLNVGLPSLADFQFPTRIVTRNRCWNDFNRRFETDSNCRYPSDDFERGTHQTLGSDNAFSASPTTWPRGNTSRKFGWSTINADVATRWFVGNQIGSTPIPFGLEDRWTVCTSFYANLKWGEVSAIEEAVTQDNTVEVDVTADLNNPATTTAAYPSTPTTADAMIFGFRHPSGTLTVDVDTAGTGAYAVTWEYYTGAVYVALSGVTDGTNGFKTAGTNDVTFTIPTDWTQQKTGDKNYRIRARVTTTGFTVIPLLSQAWSEFANNGPYMYKDISGDFDVATQVSRTGTRGEWMVGFLLQDAADESDWLFWGNVENSSSVEKMRVRQSTNGATTDTDFDLTDGDERIRITRVGTTITSYSRVLDTDSWTQKSADTWTGAPTSMRVGLVTASDVRSSSTSVQGEFKSFLFASGGFVSCNRSVSDCNERENIHQFNGFTSIPNQRTRG